MKLNQRQERFCLEYFTTGNATQAAKTSGYSKKTAVKIASENLTKPAILERLRLLREAATVECVATVIKRKEKLTEIIQNPLPSKVSAKERILAIAELNKMEGDYAPEEHLVAEKIIFEIVYVDKKEGNAV